MRERERDGKTKRKQQLKKKTNLYRSKNAAQFLLTILCILLPEAKKGSMAGCSAKRGSRKKGHVCIG